MKRNQNYLAKTTKSTLDLKIASGRESVVAKAEFCEHDFPC